ncbi:DUF2865 domain-containing protein [Beijerinckia mobilis]|uniref:DUF2865 domain-containing protein n=1 Tax=Beijerinckia mobilis TaxID=231434 RepID=UPI0006917A27|nr:DUF2865 domain-containing protein [Beijerinckia mobilis]
MSRRFPAVFPRVIARAAALASRSHENRAQERSAEENAVEAVNAKSIRTKRISAMAVIAMGVAVCAPVPLFAQSVDCGRLQAQIAAAEGRQARNPYEGTLHKQRIDYDHLARSAHSLGCDRQQFLFFGAPQPPQCAGINARLEQLQASINQLQASASQAAGNSAKTKLVDAYNYYCRGQAPRERGFFETLFNIPPELPPSVPDDAPVEAQQRPPEEESGPRRGSQLVCVKTCDGGFFPMNLSLRRNDDGEGLTEICQALCPNAEVSVFTRSPAKDISTAVSLDGTLYTDLPNASKFQKTFDPACTCKPPGQSWAEALADADWAVGREHRGDIFVTPEKSLELSQPKITQAKSEGRQRGKTASLRADRTTLPTAMPADDDPSLQEALSGASAPTAGTDSAGIGAKDIAGAPTVGAQQGVKEEETGPDGIRRRVRIVGPLL